MAKKRTAKKRSAGNPKRPSSTAVTRVPVTEETVANFGIPSPGITKGPVDQTRVRVAANMERRARIARIASGIPGAGTKSAGMMLDNMSLMGAGGIWGASSLDAYYTSYASGNTMYGGGVRDIPTYFVMMNQQNGGVLYWPVSLREKYEWYRYFARTDAYVGRALELLSDLPMSKITLHVPKLEDKKLREEIHTFYTYMCDRIKLFERLQQILWEYNMIGNVFPFHEWDDDKNMWSKIVLLPPEEVACFTYPFSDNARIEYRPEKLLELIKKEQSDPGHHSMNPFEQQIVDHIPNDIKEMVRKEGCIVMDSDPMVGGSPGSFTFHFARRRSPYMDLGASVLERVLVPMLQKENYRYTQLALATRNMTPKNKISASGLNDPELDDLRTQVDLSYMDPDYTIVTNYEWEWEQIGADARLLDLTSEYEMIENQVFAGLGVTRELLTGEGTYSGNRITIEILNTVFLLVREMLTTYIEKQLFEPVAIAHKWYTTDRNGIRKYFYPRIGFNRLSIRDNQEVFENLFQLYQKGSLPIGVILELFNLDSDSVHDRIKEDLFTVRDPTFNRTIENINDEVGRNLVENTDIAKRVAKYLGLEYKAAEGGEGEEGFGSFGAGGFGEKTKESPEEEIAESVAEEMPADSSEEEVREVVDEVVDETVGAKT